MGKFPPGFGFGLSHFLHLFAPFNDEVITILQKRVSQVLFETDADSFIWSGERLSDREYFNSSPGLIRLVEEEHKKCWLHASHGMNHHISKFLFNTNVEIKSNRYIEFQEFLNCSKKSQEDNFFPKNAARSIAQTLKLIFHKFDVHIICAVRRQDTLLESSYNQYVKQSLETSNFHDFVNSLVRRSYEFDQILDEYAEVFGKENVHVLCFESIKQNGLNQYINDFFSVIDQRFKIFLDQVPGINEALNEKGLEIKRYANQYMESVEESRKLSSLLQKMYSKNPGQKHSLFSEEKKKEYLSYYKNANKNLWG